jgi:hypothetical protein
VNASSCLKHWQSDFIVACSLTGFAFTCTFAQAGITGIWWHYLVGCYYFSPDHSMGIRSTPSTTQSQSQSQLQGASYTLDQKSVSKLFLAGAWVLDAAALLSFVLPRSESDGHQNRRTQL